MNRLLQKEAVHDIIMRAIGEVNPEIFIRFDGGKLNIEISIKYELQNGAVTWKHFRMAFHNGFNYDDAVSRERLESWAWNCWAEIPE